jgi:hypothetical protein
MNRNDDDTEAFLAGVIIAAILIGYMLNWILSQ